MFLVMNTKFLQGSILIFEETRLSLYTQCMI